MTPREVMSKCRGFFIYLAVFSFVVNLLALSTPLYMMVVFDRVLASRSTPTLFVLTAIFVFATAIQSVLDAQRTRLLKQLGDTVYARLRQPVFECLLRFRKQGEPEKHALDDLEIFKAFVSGQGLKAAFEIPWIPIFLLVLYLFHPWLSMIALGTAVALFALTYLEEVVSKPAQSAANRKQRESQDFVSHTLKNAEVVTALAMQKDVEGRWELVNDQHLEFSREAARKIGAIVSFSNFIKGVLHILAMATAAFLVINVEGVSPGVMIASTLLMGKAVAPILQVLGAWRSFISFREAYQRLDELLKDRQLLNEGLRHAAPLGHLAVESLFFYIDRDRFILNAINFKLEAGETLGVIGASASGKSTLARMMVGAYRPNDGTVRLDGADVYHWAQNGLGEYIGYLPQDQQLFAGTVAENIARMGDAFSKVEEVVDAARRAGAHEMILRLPKGYDTDIGVGGGKLSGGQRQLVALARALFGRPRFVVLDEPNTFLDGQSELTLLAAIRTLKEEGATVVIVSHKPSILQDADKVLVLGQGKQLMFGPRDEVMRRLGHVSGVVAPTGETHLVGSGVAA
jgi:PrtD family type I secretion system ABC transporter